MVAPEKIWSSPNLPTLPAAAVKLLDLSKDPEAGLDDVIAVLKTDPAITAKILKSTNSAYFGFAAEIKSIERAVPLLGKTVVNSLALSFSLSDSTMAAGPLAAHYRDYWAQSVTQAATAEMFGKLTGGAIDPADCFLAALLCDLGRLALLKAAPEEASAALQAAASRRVDLHAVENEFVGVNHVEVGQRLMQNWGLPQAVVAAARTHHDAPELLDELPKGEARELAVAVAAASSCGDYFCAANKGQALARLTGLTSRFYGFDSKNLETFLDDAKTKIDAVGDMFSVDTEAIGAAADLMVAASEHLARLALEQQLEASQAVARNQILEQRTHELETQNEQLQQRASHDTLTGLSNRAAFIEHLDRVVGAASRDAKTVGLIFSDIDKFKNLNDTHGHQFGDEVLRRVADVFNRNIRQSDLVARYGGEEFVVVVGQPTEKGLEKVTERLRAAVEAEQIHLDGERVPVTVSLGAAIAVPGRKAKGLTEKLVAEADEAMYEAKHSGRNRWTCRNLIADVENAILARAISRRFSRWLVRRGLIDIPTAQRALAEMETSHAKIGGLAIRRGWLDAAGLDAILTDQTKTNERFCRIAVRRGLLDDDQCAELLAVQAENPHSYAVSLVTFGILDRDRATEFLKEYLAEGPKILADLETALG